MHDRLYIICITHPFEAQPYLLCKYGENIMVKRDIRDILGYKELVAYGLENNSDYLRVAEDEVIPTVIDIQTAKKLLAEHPKADYTTGNEPWALRNILGINGVSTSTLSWLSDIDRLRTTTPDTHADFDTLLKDLLSGFERAWYEIEKQLQQNEELRRFYEIEVPIYNLFLGSQIAGIGLSQKNLEKKLLELKAMYYSSIKRLEFDYGFLSQKIKPYMTWHDIKEHCKLKNIGDEIDYDFWRFVEIYAEYDEFLQLLLTARDSNMDYSALLKYCVSAYKKVYAQFDVMGTVTGRILIKRPGIQYLKKTSRDIFSPSDGNSFLYADFDQFEPGIIASFSKDRRLIDLYNTGDIYEGLSQLLFGTVDRRKVAKVIFLSFIYGMSQERLGKLILDMSGQEEMRKKGLIFFREFETLSKWKQKVCDKAAACGYVSSYMGNRRYLAEEGRITSKERRWVPNQIIQGTASFILKKSLIELKRQIGEVQLLIPMHDAILLEVKEEMNDKVKSVVQALFNGTFKSVCPDIKPNVSFEEFAI
jgi:DNA polymerase I